VTAIRRTRTRISLRRRTFGMTCKAVVDNLLDGDTSRVGSYGARLAGVLFPETLKAKHLEGGRRRPGRRHCARA
jgi:hypothetical protein